MNKYGTLILTMFLTFLLGGCAAKDMTLSNQGYEALSDANYTRAEAYLSEALYLNPENPYALLNLGQVYHKTGRPDKARQMYEKVISLSPPDKERQATTDSGEEKPLVIIAAENLNRLDDRPITEERKPMDPIELFAGESETTSDEMASEFMDEPSKPVEISMADTEGIYRVQDGDTLYDIAGREEVYDHPLKWPTLYRLNRPLLEHMNITEDFETQELEEGLELKFVTPEEASERLMELGEKYWVVHVRSTLEIKNIVPTAIRLMNEGYHVYITKATVKGKEWTRLRVGFYGDRTEAEKARDRIVSFMDSTRDSWVTQIPKDELERYGGY